MSEGEQSVARFSAVQVYVHFLMAAAILVLLLTGVAITFGGHVGWIVGLIGSTNVVLVHVVAGVTLFVSLLYYVIYILTGIPTGTVPTAWVPTAGTVREVIAYAKSVLGMGPRPRPGKYTWIQKSEMLIISAELTLLTATGLLLTFPGLLLRYKPWFLAVSDVHAVLAFTLLIGVTYHLYDRHVEDFPLDESMFTGRVSMEKAREEWAGWVDAEPIETGENEPIEVAGVLIVLFVFAVLYSGILLDRVLAPIPGTSTTLFLTERPTAIIEGSFGLFWGVGLNLVVLIILAGLIALFYGLGRRFAE